MKLMETVADSFAFLEELGMQKTQINPFQIQYDYPSKPSKGYLRVLGDISQYYYNDTNYFLLDEFTQHYRMRETYLEIGVIGDSYHFIDYDGEQDARRILPAGVMFHVVRTTAAIGYMYFSRDAYCRGQSIVLRDSYCREHLFPLVHTVIGRDVDEYSLLQAAGNSCMPVWSKLLNELSCCPYQGMAAKLFLDAKLAEAEAALLDGLESLDKKLIPVFTLYEREAVEEIKSILRSSVENPPTVKQLARDFSLNPNKLQAVFKHFTGVTVMEYLRSYRMELALKLLSEGLLLEEIARSVGYRSASRFSEAFVKAHGILPSHYRRKQQYANHHD